jgi:hypothetical protein
MHPNRSTFVPVQNAHHGESSHRTDDRADTYQATRAYQVATGNVRPQEPSDNSADFCFGMGPQEARTSLDAVARVKV